MSARLGKVSPLAALFLVLVIIVAVVVGGWVFKAIALVIEVTFWTIVVVLLGFAAWKVRRR